MYITVIVHIIIHTKHIFFVLCIICDIDEPIIGRLSCKIEGKCMV